MKFGNISAFGRLSLTWQMLNMVHLEKATPWYFSCEIDEGGAWKFIDVKNKYYIGIHRVPSGK